MRQIGVSRTPVFDPARDGRAFFEALVADNLAQARAGGTDLRPRCGVRPARQADHVRPQVGKAVVSCAPRASRIRGPRWPARGWPHREDPHGGRCRGGGGGCRLARQVVGIGNTSGGPTPRRRLPCPRKPLQPRRGLAQPARRSRQTPAAGGSSEPRSPSLPGRAHHVRGGCAASCCRASSRVVPGMTEQLGCRG